MYQSAGSGTLQFSLTENGTYGSWQIVTIWTDQFGNGSANYWVKGTANGGAVRQACGWNWSGCFLDEDYTVFSISQIEYVNINSPLDDHPTFSVFGCGTQAACGKRIYLDRQFWNDTTSRNKVRVKVTLTSPISGQSIYFKSFDLDDPSTTVSPADSNDASNVPTGGDNRGSDPSGRLSAPGGFGGTNTYTATTNGSGVAETDLEVTRHPGDNFMVAASGNQPTLNGVVVTNSGTNAGITLKDSGNNVLPTSTVKNTLMLTVWRHLNLEVDNMGEVLDGSNSLFGNTGAAIHSGGNTLVSVKKTMEPSRFENGRMRIDGVDYSVVTNSHGDVTLAGTVSLSAVSNKFYVLYDDDDYDISGVLNGDEDETSIEDLVALSRIQPSDNPANNVYAHVYITPTNNGGAGNGTNYNGLADFILNVPADANTIVGYLDAARGSTGKGRDDFWISYLQIGYQGDVSQDMDSDSELSSSLLGATPTLSTSDTAGCGSVPQGGFGSLIYQEVIRDAFANLPVSIDSSTAPHEIGHQFGLKGDASGWEIMGPAPSGSSIFAPAHVNIIRCRVKSPGLS